VKRRKRLKRGGALRPVSAKRKAKRTSADGQAALRYMQAVKQLPCAVCGAPPPSDAHHVIHDRYGSAKASDWDVIPLCKRHHQDGPNAIHNGKRTWREHYGPDHGHIKATADAVEKIFGIMREKD